MELDGVLFDLDGTLADTASTERDAWPALADVIEERIPTADQKQLRHRYNAVFERHWSDFLHGRIDFGGYRWNRLRDAVAPWAELDEGLFEAYRNEKRRSIERLRLFGDAVETIAELRTAGLRVGLLTNGPSWLQRRKLEVTGLAPELDAIAISEEIGVAKPDPQAFYLAAGMLRCEPRAVAMVGDSPAYDIAGAIAAGLAASVLISAPDLQIEGATTVGTLREVPAALGLNAAPGADRRTPR